MNNRTRRNPFELDNIFVVRDAETLKVVSAPLRLRLLGLLRREPRTVKQLAAELDLPTTRLYYHVNLLESHGLIRTVETRVVSGILEKHYRASAQRLTIDRALLASGSGVAPGDAPLEAMLSAILDGTKDGVRDSVQAGLVDPEIESPGEGGLLLGRKWLRLSRAQAGELYERLMALLKEFESLDEPGSDGIAPYELLLGLYPLHEPDHAGDLNRVDEESTDERDQHDRH